MSGSINRQWILEARPTGHLTGKEFRWNETSIPKPTDGQALVRNLWLSFDPTQRNWMARELVCADGPAWGGYACRCRRAGS